MVLFKVELQFQGGFRESKCKFTL